MERAQRRLPLPNRDGKKSYYRRKKTQRNKNVTKRKRTKPRVLQGRNKPRSGSEPKEKQCRHHGISHFSDSEDQN